ncbi:MAG: hypothetical protein QQW96_23575 [Tychonema bourrellyi B0820]|nr:hypothetical protein [Tychonema bourrellyi B0820]
MGIGNWALGIGHWCQLNIKPIVRQGFKPLPQRRHSSQRGLKNSLVLFERTLAIRQGIHSLAD